MSIYRFVGDHADVFNPAYQFRSFGQKAEIDDALAQQLVRKRIPLIPEAEFEAIGFTGDELAAHPSAVSHMSAPDEFKRKKKTALLALDEFRKSLAAHIATSPTGSAA
jgi:hypothetical protein